jgi:membrane protease YdiL (CAAX protease family)
LIVLVTALAVVLSFALAWAFGRAWSLLVARAGRFAPSLTFAEAFLALGGFAFATLAAAVGIVMALGGSPRSLGAALAVGTPGYLASVIGTLAGQVAVVGFARARAADLGFRLPSPRGWGLGLAAGGGGLLLSGVMTLVADRLGEGLEDQGIVENLRDAPPESAALLLLFVTLLAPVSEELVFRGYLQAAFGERLGRRAGIVFTAVLFGLFHLADPWVVPPIVILGLLLGAARARTGSVWPGVLGHVLNNAVALALTL